MNIKIHKTKVSDVVALCDKDLVGKTLKGDGVEMKLTKRFYEGEDMPEEKVIQILKVANAINIVGKKSIEVALKARVIEEDNIKKIDGIPYAMSVSL